MTNAPAKDVDLWPPNKVLDLKVGQFMDKFFLVNFTAPGDDYDAGKRKQTIVSDPDLKAKVGYFFVSASKYNLTYSYMSRTLPNCPNTTLPECRVTRQFTDSDIIAGSVDSPLNATEGVVLVLPMTWTVNATAGLVIDTIFCFVLAFS